MINLDSVLKRRDITLPTKIHRVKSYGFSSSHIQMWELGHKEGWVPKNGCFQTVVLEKTLESPLDCKEMKPFKPQSVQSLSRVWLFATPWTAAHQASLSITNSWSPPKPMSIWVGDAIQPSHPLSSPSPPALKSFPASGSFQMSQLFIWGGQSIGVSASTSVLPMNTQDWSPLGWTGWIPLRSKGLSGVFSNTTVQKHQFFSAQLFLWSNSHIHMEIKPEYWKDWSWSWSSNTLATWCKESTHWKWPCC